MSTRQLRLNTAEQIRKRLGEFTGKKINIVLNDNTVILGQLKAMNDREVEILNMRLKKVILPLSTINEIYFDTKE